jgi:hypothetical protein
LSPTTNALTVRSKVNVAAQMLKELFAEGFAQRLPKKEEDDQLQHTFSQSISHHDSEDQRPVVLNFHKSEQEFNKRASKD